MSNFWEDGEFGSWAATSMDDHLGDTPKVSSILQRVVNGTVLQENLPAGFRVAFDGKLSSVMAYEDPPIASIYGTVVAVRTANGTTTSHNGMVFVKWDDERFMGVHKAHLQPAPLSVRVAQVSEYRRVISSLGDLDGFLRFGSDTPDLVHKATKDLWSLKKDGGEYVIERLFNEAGKPLKV